MLKYSYRVFALNLSGLPRIRTTVVAVSIPMSNRISQLRSGHANAVRLLSHLASPTIPTYRPHTPLSSSRIRILTQYQFGYARAVRTVYVTGFLNRSRVGRKQGGEGRLQKTGSGLGDGSVEGCAECLGVER